MKTLFIHMGTPKTGSSALQQFLKNNADNLFRDGIVYRNMPYTDYHRETHVQNSSGEIVVEEAFGRPSMTRNGFFLHGKIYGQYQDENLARLAEGLALVNKWFSDGDNVLLTDEHLWLSYMLWDFPERIKAFADENSITVKIIVFLRPQYDLLDSHYREEVKTHYRSVKWEEYQAQDVLLEKVFGLSYDKRMETMAGLFGHENLIMVPYEPKTWAAHNKTIFSIFMDALGVSDISRYVLPGKPANESLSYNQVEIMRNLNYLADPDMPDMHKIQQIFWKTGLQCSAVHPDKKPYSYLTEDEKQAFMSGYSDGNRKIAKEYLGKDSLFEDKPRETVKWEADASSMQDDIILFFGSTTRKIYEELQELKQETSEISRYSIGNKLHRFLSRIKNKLFGRKKQKGA